MNPESAQLILNTPAGAELRQFLARSIVSLDSVADITAEDPVEVAVEVKARKLAQDKLTTILATLVSLQDVRKAEETESDFGM